MSEWIDNSCSFPESDGEYLVVLKGWDVATTLDFDIGEGWDCYDASEILYWMPFPAPPKDE